MLRLSVRDEEFLMIGDDVKIVFLGSSGGQTRITVSYTHLTLPTNSRV